MTKKLFAITVLWFVMLIAVSCHLDHTVKTATFYVHNKSQFQVTELLTWFSISTESEFGEILEPGENCTFTPEWVDGKNISITLNFHMKGEEYGSRGREEAMTDTRRFKPRKRITDGDTVIVHIYDDHWEWW